jgi:hypothetical protein
VIHYLKPSNTWFEIVVEDVNPTPFVEAIKKTN